MVEEPPNRRFSLTMSQEVFRLRLRMTVEEMDAEMVNHAPNLGKPQANPPVVTLNISRHSSAIPNLVFTEQGRIRPTLCSHRKLANALLS